MNETLNLARKRYPYYKWTVFQGGGVYYITAYARYDPRVSWSETMQKGTKRILAIKTAVVRIRLRRMHDSRSMFGYYPIPIT